MLHTAFDLQNNVRFTFYHSVLTLKKFNSLQNIFKNSLHQPLQGFDIYSSKLAFKKISSGVNVSF